MTDRSRALALLGRPVYAQLFGAARERIEADGSRAKSLTLRGLEDEERAALADLLGETRLPGATVRLRLDRLDAVLRESPVGIGLRDLLEELGGPLVDRGEVAQAARTEEEAMWARAAARTRPELQGWLAELRRLGLLTRASEPAEALLEQALTAVEALPDAEGVALGVLATRISGDAHALDPGRPLANLVLRAAALLAGWSAPPSSAGDRRRLWAEVGVLTDALSSQVLVLGLRPLGEGWLARQLRASAEVGEPRRLTLRELARGELRFESNTRISICENPVIVERAADALGPDCAPLVCTEGVPSVAVWRLLVPLAQAGIALRFHCDFDWGGLRIGDLLHQRLGAQPWRFGVAEYMAAAGPGVALGGESVEASWDADLGPAMARRGQAVHEERVLAELLGDLGGS